MGTLTHTELAAIQAEVNAMPAPRAIQRIQRVVRQQPFAVQHPRQYPYCEDYWTDNWSLMTIARRWWSKGEHRL